jgi:ribosomal protein L24
MADPEKGGGVREISKSIHVSKVQLADPESGKPTKVPTPKLHRLGLSRVS